jgi:hypothetical protein
MIKKKVLNYNFKMKLILNLEFKIVKNKLKNIGNLLAKKF